jgi:hypothetical protein
VRAVHARLTRGLAAMAACTAGWRTINPIVSRGHEMYSGGWLLRSNHSGSPQCALRNKSSLGIFPGYRPARMSNRPPCADRINSRPLLGEL